MVVIPETIIFRLIWRTFHDLAHYKTIARLRSKDHCLIKPHTNTRLKYFCMWFEL